MNNKILKKMSLVVFVFLLGAIGMYSNQAEAATHYSEKWPVEVVSQLPEGKKKRYFMINFSVGDVKDVFNNVGQPKNILQVMANGKEVPDDYHLVAADITGDIVVRLDPDKSVEVQWGDSPLKQYFMVGTTIKEVKSFFNRSLEFKNALAESLHISDISPDYMKVNVKGQEKSDDYALQQQDEPVVVWLTAKKIATSIYKKLRGRDKE